IGCSNGWRVKKLRERYNWKVLGIDPSENAIAAGGGEENGLYVGTALDLRKHLSEGEADLIIYGYCLAFVDPEDYFQIITDCDWALADGGAVIIHDGLHARPYKSRYVGIEESNKKGETRETVIWLHILDFKQLWLAHPHYREVVERLDTEKADVVVMLQKRKEGSFTVLTLDPELLPKYVYE